MTTTGRNKEVVRRAARAWNERNRADFDACYGDLLTVRTREGEEDFTITHDQHWDAAESWFEIELTEEIKHLVAEGDLVFVQARYRARHTREMGGAEPTGRIIEWDTWQILRLEDGRIVEEITLMDELDMLRQLGATKLPTP